MIDDFVKSRRVGVFLVHLSLADVDSRDLWQEAR